MGTGMGITQWECEGMGALTAFLLTSLMCRQSAPHYRRIATPTPHHSIFTCRMLFLKPGQQRQSTEGNNMFKINISLFNISTCRKKACVIQQSE